MRSQAKPQLTGKTVGQVIDEVIKESLAGGLSDRTRKEQGKQQALATQCSASGGMSELDEEDDESEGSGGGNKKDDKKSSKHDDHEDDDKGSDDGEGKGDGKKRVPDIDDVVEKLNAFRSGRSFRDDEVQSSFSNYFEKLSDAEKAALYSFAKGIAQIVTGEVPADKASEPGDHPTDVKMTRTGPQKKHLDPNVIKKAEPPKGQGKPTDKKGEEDTTPPSPIKASGK